MLGGLTGFKPPTANDFFGERMINSVATQSIRHLFSHCDWLDVVLRCSPPSKMLQGTIDSFRMEGRGLVIRKQFEAAEMMFETDAVAVDAAALLSGKIRLRQPTQAIAQVILTEDAINRAFEADLVKQKLQAVDHPDITQLSGGEPVGFREVMIKLHPNQRVAIAAKTDLPNRKDVPLQMTATLQVEKRRRVLFADAQFDPEGIEETLRPLSKALTMAFAGVLNQMVDLDKFNLDGVMLRVNRLETHGDRVTFSGYAQIDHFPGMA